MKTRASRSLKATVEGIKQANKAVLKFATKTELAVELEVSRATVQNFFAGKPVARENFHKICEKLGISWQEIADFPEQYLLSESTVNISCQDFSGFISRNIQQNIQTVIQQKCGSFRVLDMSQPRTLQEVYTSLNILENISNRNWLEIEQLHQNFNLIDDNKIVSSNSKIQDFSALQAVKKYSKLILLGKPGSGKTTLLKHIAIESVSENLIILKIPIFITLKNFAESRYKLSLVTYIKQELASYGINKLFATQILNQGQALILLDGLDEVGQKDIYCVLQQISEISTKYHTNQFILTCRIGSTEYNLEHFTEVELTDFNQYQISSFVKKWFAGTAIDKGKRFLLKLQQNPRLQELATNPLLLTLLCLVFAEAGHFPTNRNKLYQEALDILLKKWDAKRYVERDEVYKQLSVSRKHELLSYIARNTFEKGEYFFKQQDLERYIAEYIYNFPDVCACGQSLSFKPEAILKAIEAQHGLLVERAKGIYSFSHLTFQEYFTAKNIVCNAEAKGDKALTQLANCITDKRWQEIFILCVGMLPQADYLLLLAKKYIDYLLADDIQLQQFLRWLDAKSYNTSSSCSLLNLRAFYLDLELSRTCGIIEGKLELSKACNPAFTRYINSELSLDLALDRVLTIDYILKQTTQPVLIYHRVLDRAIVRASLVAPELRQVLQALKQHTIDYCQSNDSFIKWWITAGQDEITLLRNAVIQQRNFAYDWHFNPHQQNLLKQYYDTTILLLNCLNSNCVSIEVRQKIANSILLPSAKLSQVAV
ncbi:NACHT domain-containing NTPase [Gloeocapsopsis sp. IPPAS B-1203]|uniref:NACHT domain-containing protein n=1 Tax=Gloeocapsopsis sp. IPPAS B-1203 TaxID=2049454 RepID=UPI000C17CB09|nr:NACHT domain-containing NTPase [Gloeocapsopsis sp. IPPAS B-1203]PIG92904.1 NTPase (NACHT family) [Gloeocapsopsis sp. IPPAS B-1203]